MSLWDESNDQNFYGKVLYPIAIPLPIARVKKKKKYVLQVVKYARNTKLIAQHQATLFLKIKILFCINFKEMISPMFLEILGRQV